ncbi:MAG TPA: SMI1/KNR4 family protein [Allosphingosinicella sp.]|jgi:hypothetical protein
MLPKGWVIHHPGPVGIVQVIPFELHGANPHSGGFRPTAAPARATGGFPLTGGPGRLSDGGEPLREAQLRALDDEFGCALPGAYRQFLLDSNGGRPEHQAVLRQEGDSGDLVDRFFGLEPAGADSLLGAFDLYSSRVPRGLLPVARDPFGNLFLLGLAGPRLGTVCFWDHEAELDEPRRRHRNVTLTADDFSAFLALFGRALE